ncbi:MAG: hypothetical protein Q8M16_23180, partial [Pirellulaceae bacterium]|nr:hypothetical protein [Pirellulaceae bacterium]
MKRALKAVGPSLLQTRLQVGRSGKSRRFTRRIFSVSRYIMKRALKAVGPSLLQTRLQVGRSGLILGTESPDLRACAVAVSVEFTC